MLNNYKNDNFDIYIKRKCTPKCYTLKIIGLNDESLSCDIVNTIIIPTNIIDDVLMASV